MACESSGFVFLDFTQATLVQSNLGGQGGRCSMLTAFGTPSCIEPAPLVSTPNNSHLLFSDVGRVLGGGDAPEAERVWLQITNETEYRAWNANANGVKRQMYGGETGFFGVGTPRAELRVAASARAMHDAGHMRPCAVAATLASVAWNTCW
jgi:hypothetical protein